MLSRMSQIVSRHLESQKNAVQQLQGSLDVVLTYLNEVISGERTLESAHMSQGMDLINMLQKSQNPAVPSLGSALADVRQAFYRSEHLLRLL